jgi:hypothetical protein
MFASRAITIFTETYENEKKCFLSSQTKTIILKKKILEMHTDAFKIFKKLMGNLIT